MKSVKRVHERSNLRFSVVLCAIRPFMYALRNFVRFSREKKPWRTDFNLAWNFGRTKEESVIVLSELLLADYCFDPPLDRY